MQSISARRAGTARSTRSTPFGKCESSATAWSAQSRIRPSLLNLRLIERCLFTRRRVGWCGHPNLNPHRRGMGKELEWAFSSSSGLLVRASEFEPSVVVAILIVWWWVSWCAHTHENSTCGKLCSVSSLDRPMLFRACSNVVSCLCLQGLWRTESKRLSR